MHLKGFIAETISRLLPANEASQVKAKLNFPRSFYLFFFHASMRNCGRREGNPRLRQPRHTIPIPNKTQKIKQNIWLKKIQTLQTLQTNISIFYAHHVASY